MSYNADQVDKVIEQIVTAQGEFIQACATERVTPRVEDFARYLLFKDAYSYGAHDQQYHIREALKAFGDGPIKSEVLSPATQFVQGHIGC